MERIITIFCIFIFSGLIAQTRGIVKDSGGRSIPYVTVKIIEDNITTTANVYGVFSIKATYEDKMLLFSALGYEDKKVVAKEANTVVLKTKAIELDEVVISKKNEKEFRIGRSEPLGHVFFPTELMIFSKLFYYDTSYVNTPFLKNVIMYTDCEVEKALFRLRIHSVGKNGKPGEDLLNEDIIVEILEGNRENTIDIAKLNMVLPKEGIYIGFEWLDLEQNKHKREYLPEYMDVADKTFYSPALIIHKGDKKDRSYKFENGKWHRERWVFHSPAIDLVLTN